MGKALPCTRVLALLVLILLASFACGAHAATERERAGLIGPVRRVVIERTMPSGQRAYWTGDSSTDEERLARQRATFGARVPVEGWFETPEHLAPANLGAWQGRVVGLVGTFQTWLAADTALFMVGHAQGVVLRHTPAGRFTHRGEQALIAGRLQGTAAVSLPFSGPTVVPELHVHAIEATPLLFRKTVEYDAQGSETEKTYYSPEYGDDDRRTQRALYDAQGQVRERITDVYRADQHRQTERALYDAQGQVRERITDVYRADQHRWTEHNLYDAHGHLLKSTHYGAAGTPELVWNARNTYDAHGHLVETVHSRDGGALGLRGSMPTNSETRYTYDDQGRLLEETGWSDGLHGRAWTKRYIYAPQGYRLEEATPGENRFASRTLTMYDPQGRILETVSYQHRFFCHEDAAHAGGPLAEFEQQTLGDLGPPQEDECLAWRDRSTYEVDETTGNWLKQTTHRWAPSRPTFEPFTVEYRTIMYEGAP